MPISSDVIDAFNIININIGTLVKTYVGGYTGRETVKRRHPPETSYHTHYNPAQCVYFNTASVHQSVTGHRDQSTHEVTVHFMEHLISFSNGYFIFGYLITHSL